MSLTLHYHPLSSFCWKALIALYENNTRSRRIRSISATRPSAPRCSNCGRSASFLCCATRRAARPFRNPASSSNISTPTIPGRTRFIPENPGLALQARLRDRFYDLYVHLPMQKIIGDRLRPVDKRDPHGVEEARAQLRTSYRMIEQQMAGSPWAIGEAFGIADCAALPSLFYGNKVEPFGASHNNVAAYFERLKARPSIARVIEEAGPYFRHGPEGGCLNDLDRPRGNNPRHFCRLSGQ